MDGRHLGGAGVIQKKESGSPMMDSEARAVESKARGLSRKRSVNPPDGMLQPPRVAQFGEDAAAARERDDPGG
jgi:hypothetical protein